MAIVIRRGDLGSDRDILVALLSRHLGPHCDSRRFDWLYRDNPSGPAQVWIAVEGMRDEAVGMAAVFPRLMYFERRQEIGCVLGDFCLEEAARSLGPALQLQRACMAEIDSGKLPIGYDLPSARMLAVYKRMGLEPRGRFIRFAKLLRTDETIAHVLGDGMLASMASACSNRFVAAFNRRRTSVQGLELSKQDEACSADFCTLARRVGNSFGTCVVRSAQYLNWRYRSHPYRPYEMITARRHGELCGYSVFHAGDKHAAIADLLAIEESVLEALLHEMVDHLQIRGTCTVSCSALGSSRLAQILRRDGFRPRETMPVILFESGQAKSGTRSVNDSCWFLLQGDRES
jgi:hypothetical protein